MKRKDVLAEALSLCPMKGDGFIPCDHCPMMQEGCDEPFIEYVTLPRFLVDEIRMVLTEPGAEPMTKERWLS